MAVSRSGATGGGDRSRTSQAHRTLVTFCTGVPGRENGGRPAYGFAVAWGVEPADAPARTAPKGRRFFRGGGDRDGLAPEGLGWENVHYRVALLGGGSDYKYTRGGLGEEALDAVTEYRAVGAALRWLEGRGCRRDRVVLFTGSKTLARREEEPFGVWRASRRPIEGDALKEALVAMARFGDLSAEWWRPGCPGRPEDLVALAGEAAHEIPARVRVAVLEEGRRVRAKEVELEKIGRGLYRSNGRYVVDAILGLCGCRDFEIRNGKKRPIAGVALVRCKHLIAAEEAHGEAEEGPRSGERGVPGPASP